MSTQSLGRRQARRDFIPGAKPKVQERWCVRYTDAYVAEWEELQTDYDQEQEKQNEPPTLEERIEALEDQVRVLTELLQP